MTTRTVGIVGTGVIGAAWAALFLSRGCTVGAHDPSPGARERLEGSIFAAWPALSRLGDVPEEPLAGLRWSDDVAGAVRDASFVQESGPERLDLKQALIAEIDSHAPVPAVIASSSSGLRPTQVQATCAHPERVLVGHPFHPAHLIPLVEVVGGEQTSQQAVDDAMALYAEAGKRPVHVRQELDGHLVNRLQAALWREAYDLVARGAATVADVDAAITNGPGLRWALVGPFAGQHLSGGSGGIAHNLEHLGPPMVAWWDDLATPEWTPELRARVTEQMAAEMGTTTSAELSAARDDLLLGILAAKRSTDGLTT
ncbi:MAG TPA: 3-hydroxyacyl-CoA dehydrogenase NAD-binding domain-containing protein [Candidatus Nanopelagicales bacterium]|nr:3-hydroxyacyl-CoA dehydrogenase NAD-binding domain-containing protein [Candidatus Nanopelagicales bacterium]